MLHGSASNGGLSSGGGPHSVGDDLFTSPLVKRSFVQEPNGGSRLRDDPGYSRSSSDDDSYANAPTEGEEMPDDAPIRPSFPRVQTEVKDPTKNISPLIDSEGNGYTENNGVQDSGSAGYDYTGTWTPDRSVKL